MRLWPEMFGASIKKIAFSCSCIALAVVGIAQNYSECAAKLRSAPSQADFGQQLKQLSPKLESFPDLGDGLDEAVAKYLVKANRTSADQIIEKLELRALGEDTSIDNKALQTRVKQMKSSPIYSDVDQKSSNWLDRAFRNLVRFDMPQRKKRRTSQSFEAMNGNLIYGAVYTILAVAACVALYFLFKGVQVRRALRRNVGALLEDDEPMRTLDEWLVLSEKLSADGKYREAVRCLFLACLLRFDEHLVARFDRGETNWEHYRRIKASPKLPESLDFLEPTKAFDVIWYGMRVRGLEDVNRFRLWYQDVTDTLRSKN